MIRRTNVNTDYTVCALHDMVEGLIDCLAHSDLSRL